MFWCTPALFLRELRRRSGLFCPRSSFSLPNSLFNRSPLFVGRKLFSILYKYNISNREHINACYTICYAIIKEQSGRIKEQLGKIKEHNGKALGNKRTNWAIKEQIGKESWNKRTNWDNKPQKGTSFMCNSSSHFALLFSATLFSGSKNINSKSVFENPSHNVCPVSERFVGIARHRR